MKHDLEKILTDAMIAFTLNLLAVLAINEIWP